MKKWCIFFKDLLRYIISGPILSAASVISQNLIIQELPWQKSHPPILQVHAHAILSITQNMRLGTVSYVITFLPNVGRFSDFGAKSSNGAHSMIFK